MYCTVLAPASGQLHNSSWTTVSITCSRPQ